MNDRAIGLLEQYEVEVFRTRKGRGAIICDTDQGCLIFKEYTGNTEKLAIQDQVLSHIAGQGRVSTEQMMRTREGELFVRDNDGVRYILKTYVEGRECNIADKAECMEAMRLLARLHECMEIPEIILPQIPVYSQTKEYEKHNRELKRVRKFLQQRSQKTRFEIKLLHSFDSFLEQGMAVEEAWKLYEQIGRSQGARWVPACCHGDYQYHNLLKNGTDWFIINFEKCIRDDSVRDIYLIMRKLLEKTGWSVTFGRELLNAYEKERPICALSRIDLYYRFAYPEKFWKIANFYYNSGKAWIPEKNLEKLDKLLQQEEAKQRFLQEVFSVS